MKTQIRPVLLLSIRLLLILLSLVVMPEAQAFTHPGIPQTSDDLALIKANLNKEPWKSGYAALAADYRSQLSYTMQGPFAHVGRNPNINLTQWRNDMIAVWNLARIEVEPKTRTENC